MEKLQLAITALLLTATLQAQNLEWGFNVGSLSPNVGYDGWEGAQLTSTGNLMVYGSVDFEANFNPLGNPIYNQSYSDKKKIATYSPQGQLLQLLEHSGSMVIKDIKLDADDNMLILSNYQSSNVDIDFSSSAYYLQMIDSSANYCISKHAPNGSLIWAKPFYFPFVSNNLSIDKDAAGHIYLAGNFGFAQPNVGTVIDVDFDATVYNLTSLGLEDLFLAKYDANDGHLHWAFNIGVPPQCWTGNCHAEEVLMGGLSVDEAGNSYLVANFGDRLDIDPNPNTVVYFNEAINGATALLKYDTDGNLVWGQHIGHGTGNTDFKLAARANNGDIFLRHWFGGEIDLDPSANTVNVQPAAVQATNSIVVRYDRDGNYLWHHIEEDYSISMQVHTGNNGDYFIEFTNMGGTAPMVNVDFINNSQPCLIDATHSAVAKYDANNNFVSVWKSERSFLRKLLVDANENIYTVGYVDSAGCNFDWQGDSIANFTDYEFFDAFIAKYAPSSPVAIVESENTALAIFPNPSHNLVNIQLLEPSTIQLFNLNGQLLSTETVETATLHTISIANLPQAVYTVKVISQSGKIYSQKLVKY
jgi:Secretion system C-terminal sorting domain